MTTTTRKPDIELIHAAQAGDLAARDELLERHKGFIWLMVRKAIGPGPRQIDAEQYYSLGVMTAIRSIKRFDQTKATSLLTYMGVGISRDVRRELMHDTTIRRSVRPRGLIAANHEAWKRTGRGAELVEAYMAVDPRSRECVESVDDRDARSAMVRAMEDLPPTCRRVLEERLKGRTFKDIGQEIGVVRERVRQIELEAIEALQVALGVERTQSVSIKRVTTRPRRAIKKRVRLSTEDG
jgi:RNA polymerase sigma factor (sigma-70 family)